MEAGVIEKRLPPTVHAGRGYGKQDYFSQYITVSVMVGRLLLIVHGGRWYGKKVTYSTLQAIS